MVNSSASHIMRKEWARPNLRNVFGDGDVELEYRENSQDIKEGFRMSDGESIDVA